VAIPGGSRPGTGRGGAAVLKTVAALLLTLLARKAFVDVDIFNFDSLSYHLPFAARLWGITSPGEFAFFDRLEYIYQGFPLLGEIAQGLFWRFFDRMQAANLVALVSLLVYCSFARTFFRIPWHVMVLALLAVPLIQIHATASLVDLPANLATAVMLLLAYRVYAETALPRWRDIAVFAVAAAVSANTKFLHTALIAVAVAAVLLRLVYRYRPSEPPTRRLIRHRVLFLVIAMPLIFATAVKNTIVHGNPVFPIEVRALGTALPHALTAAVKRPEYLRNAPQPVCWLLSIFEIRAFDGRRPYLWTGEQGYLPAGVPADRMGGYFFLYVIMNLALLAFLIARVRSREARLGGMLFMVLSALTSMHPQSHELRYHMHWIIVLISLNLYLLGRCQDRRVCPLTPQHFGIGCCAVLLLVIGLTRGAYLRPYAQPIVVAYTKAIEATLRDAIQRSPEICVVGRTNLFFLYADTFHPPMRYSVKAARSAQECGARVVVPAR
jgi:hypothetical protein